MNEDKRIIELTATSELDPTDFLPIDNSKSSSEENSGTRKIRVQTLLDITLKVMLTQAEYDDLPSSKLTDGKVYYITDESKIIINGAVYGAGGETVADVYVNGASVLDANKIAQIKSYKEVTQAEYDALPSSKLTDGILYCIKDTEFSAEDIDYDNTDSGLESENVQDAIDEISNDISTALTVHGTSSGEIATFTDGSSLPMPSLKVGIEPIQEGSGDPSPTNVRPIIGHTEANVSVVGKNLADGYTIAQSIETNGGTLDTINKTISYSGSVARATGKLPIKFKDNTQYTIMARVTSESNATNINARVVYTDGTTQNLADMTKGVTKVWTSNAGKSVDYITFEWITGTTTMYYEELGVFEGVLTADDFEPYNGQTYTIQFKDGDNPLIVYGGSLDVVSGELVVDRAYVDLGDLNWQYSSGSAYFSATISDCIIPTIYSYHKPICEAYKGINPNYINSLQSGEVMYNTTYGAVFLKDSRYTDATAFKLAVSGIKLVYELATPITYQLTPTMVKSLLGSNNVWADCGDVIEANYIRCLDITINDLISRLEG